MACRTGRDYPDALGPRYTGGLSRDVVAIERGRQPRAGGIPLRVVSFNIAFARRIDAAISLLTSDSMLRGADIVLLQEMDAAGTQRIADALGMSYVYYPASNSGRTRRDFGNAVLSRWPVVEDAKLVLPHASRYARTHRGATGATLNVNGTRVRVYSTHLATIADLTPRRRREQLRAILADAATYPLVVIGGDLNDANVGRIARDEAGYTWPTQYGPRTTAFGRWDHVFLKGLRSPASAGAGMVRSRDISDHHAIWAVGLLP
jgi:endonuclease/exonuclease/phosphatase family metal-dependent hydrolase